MSGVFFRSGFLQPQPPAAPPCHHGCDDEPYDSGFSPVILDWSRMEPMYGTPPPSPPPPPVPPPKAEEASPVKVDCDCSDCSNVPRCCICGPGKGCRVCKPYIYCKRKKNHLKQSPNPVKRKKWTYADLDVEPEYQPYQPPPARPWYQRTCGHKGGYEEACPECEAINNPPPP